MKGGWGDVHQSNKMVEEKFPRKLLALKSSVLPDEDQFVSGISASQ